MWGARLDFFRDMGTYLIPQEKTKQHTSKMVNTGKEVPATYRIEAA